MCVYHARECCCSSGTSQSLTVSAYTRSLPYKNISSIIRFSSSVSKSTAFSPATSSSSKSHVLSTFTEKWEKQDGTGIIYRELSRKDNDNIIDKIYSVWYPSFSQNEHRNRTVLRPKVLWTLRTLPFEGKPSDPPSPITSWRFGLHRWVNLWGYLNPYRIFPLSSALLPSWLDWTMQRITQPPMSRTITPAAIPSKNGQFYIKMKIWNFCRKIFFVPTCDGITR